MTIDRRNVPQRDLHKTGFTAALRGMVAEVPGLHAVAFCDEEGEIIDYHSYLEPFDTKITGAVLGVVLAMIVREAPHLARGGVREILIETDQHLLFARRTFGDYFLAGVLARDAVVGKLLAALDAVEARVMAEAGL